MTFTYADLRRLNRACTFSSGHKAVLFALSTYMDGQGRARPGLETLEADSGLSANRVRAILRDLVEAGFVAVTKEKVGTVYTLQKLPEKTEGCPQPQDGCPQPQDGCPQPQDGCPQPQDGCPQPQDGCPQPQDGCPQPFLLYKGKDQEGPRRTNEASNAGAGATPARFAESGDELVNYRGSRQPLARLAWAEKLAKAQVEALGISPVTSPDDVAELRGEWQAFLLGMAERVRADQAPMIRVDVAARRLREIFKGGGMSFALEAVRYAIVSGAAWPVPRPTGTRLAQAKFSATTSHVGAYDNAI